MCQGSLRAAAQCPLPPPLQGTGAEAVRPVVERALAAAAALRGRRHSVGAAAELLERAARIMRLEPAGWAAAMWAVLRVLQLGD